VLKKETRGQGLGEEQADELVLKLESLEDKLSKLVVLN
jgi:hypothetical protein